MRMYTVREALAGESPLIDRLYLPTKLGPQRVKRVYGHRDERGVVGEYWVATSLWGVTNTFLVSPDTLLYSDPLEAAEQKPAKESPLSDEERHKVLAELTRKSAEYGLEF